VPDPDFEPAAVPTAAILSNSDTRSAVTYTQKTVTRENRRIIGGIAAGAAAGSIIPGLGTLAGAAIGFFSSLFMGANLDKMKRETKESLREPLRRHFDETAATAAAYWTQQIEQQRTRLCSEIDRYLLAYQETVSQWIAEEEQNRLSLEAEIQSITYDLQQIDNRKFTLDSVRCQLLPQQEAISS
jgi:gas vesicle protein